MRRVKSGKLEYEKEWEPDGTFETMSAMLQTARQVNFDRRCIENT